MQVEAVVAVKAFEVVAWLVLGGVVGTLGDNPIGWTLFGIAAIWAAVGGLPVWVRHPRLVGFCRGVSVSIVVVMVCVAVGLLSLGGRP